MQTAPNNTPSAFSETNPNMQLVWDSTSFKALQTCPRYYQLAIKDGWRTSGESVHLDFGYYFAGSVETFKKARLAGKTREEATLLAIQWAVEHTWILQGSCEACAGDDPHVCEHCEENSFPWGGKYEDQWRCTGTEPYKNSKGNKAKCPWSHKGKWFPGPVGDTCGTCGSPTHTERRYAPNDKTKNRKTLVRLVAAYCDHQPEKLTHGLAPFKFPNGTPAVELSFKFPLPYTTKAGEPFILSGHLDSIMEAVGQGERFISDNKTTKSTMGAGYWKQFAPNTQVDTYDFAASMIFPDLNIKGVMIEGAQTLVGGEVLSTQIFYRDESQREEYFKELGFWLKLAEKFAEENYWPMNRANCKMCQFQPVCSKPPARREEYLQADYVVRKWNPLEER